MNRTKQVRLPGVRATHELRSKDESNLLPSEASVPV